VNKNGDPAGDAVRPFWRRYLHAALIGITLVALTTAMFPVTSLLTPPGTPEIGDVAGKDIIAPYTIAIKRTAEELELEKERVLQTVPLVFEYETEVADSIKREADLLFSALVVIGDGQKEWERLALSFPHLAIPEALRVTAPGTRVRARETVDSALSQAYHFGVMRNQLELPASPSHTAAIVRGQTEQVIQRGHLLDVPEAQALLRAELRRAISDSSTRVTFYELSRQWLVPNLELDVRATERRKEVALSAIPTNKGVILKDDFIIRAGERVTAHHVEALRALAESQASAERQGDPWKFSVPLIARVLFLAAIFVGFGVALHTAAPNVLANTRSLLALGVLYAFEIALAYMIYFRWDISSYLLPITVGTMLATILFSLGVGLGFALFLALVLGVVSGFDFAPVFLAASAGVVASLAVRNVRQRYHFYRPILFLAVTYIVVVGLLEALRFTPPVQIFERAGYGALNGILSPIVTIGLLPIFETTFRLTTDITLLELADMNHPLLRRLAVAAPGTYHHSIIVANLCEAAAEAVDANPLLARVGAYFHDIGKVEKPEYFVENQMGRKSKHDGLAPTMSALILSAHIKAGAEMARDARLPDVIIDFIEEHHGTTQMSYFYGKAKEQAGEDISDSDFKYPGPKPRSKETAILMLADSTEAVSRTLEDPRPNRLRGAIHQVVTDKFMAGQLSDCPLTLADLSKIEDAFLHLLLGAFHGRVKYPQQVEEARRRKEEMFG
jgi:hypothetical protein